MHIVILGRQPAIGVAELERIHGAKYVRWFSDTSALVNDTNFSFNRLGGSLKAGKITIKTKGDWHQVSKELIEFYSNKWASFEGKLTLGISAYGFKISGRDTQKTGILIKNRLKAYGVNIRLVPNPEPALNSASSHHNKLGLSNNHPELIIVKSGKGDVIVSESIGAQNITSFAGRDQARPKTDAFVGMLPPKLAKIMVNLSSLSTGRILDPFCGTGVILQESVLMDFAVYGTDLSEKMIDYTSTNLTWLEDKTNIKINKTIQQGDATKHNWELPINAVVSETYLGQPFSAPPSPAKLTEVTGNCNYIITNFLKNIAPQLKSGTPLVLAIPAWASKTGDFTHLDLINNLPKLGYNRIQLKNITSSELLYYRPGQVVARELLLLQKT